MNGHRHEQHIVALLKQHVVHQQRVVAPTYNTFLMDDPTKLDLQNALSGKPQRVVPQKRGCKTCFSAAFWEKEFYKILEDLYKARGKDLGPINTWRPTIQTKLIHYLVFVFFFQTKTLRVLGGWEIPKRCRVSSISIDFSRSSLFFHLFVYYIRVSSSR